MTMDGTECAVAAFPLLVHRLAVVLALVLGAGCLVLVPSCPGLKVPGWAERLVGSRMRVGRGGEEAEGEEEVGDSEEVDVAQRALGGGGGCGGSTCGLRSAVCGLRSAEAVVGGLPAVVHLGKDRMRWEDPVVWS
ncbi:hypothetical protein BDP81DRAFT_474873 [Colletotrichum phormii]|uniref:Uncharacterized protein n=1 Tax=Colletotrichum phormii TaxID=359342 RepID=A0AAI9ZHP2_9PEZI|nr:uncharacterized protein BDP81DRAFT_474873 [Colletotrichum phormii]KAK1624784.1 hypothetical protein BDP81DRAFT_474873 [Colletotrichum phormii]